MKVNEEKFERFRLDLGYRLRSIREFHELTLEEMAERIGVSISYVRISESGKETPNLMYLYAVSKTFGFNLEDFVELEKKEFLKKLYFG